GNPGYTLSASARSPASGKSFVAKELSLIQPADAPIPCEISGLAGLFPALPSIGDIQECQSMTSIFPVVRKHCLYPRPPTSQTYANAIPSRSQPIMSLRWALAATYGASRLSI